MKYKLHAKISFKWFDLWVGLYIDRPAKALYLCILPMLPIKVWVTQHEACPRCGKAMQKIAYDVTPEGYALFWECPDITCQEEIDIEWDMDFAGTEWITSSELERHGYEIV